MDITAVNINDLSPASVTAFQSKLKVKDRSVEEFMELFLSVSKAKRNTLTYGAAWTNRVNLIHVTDLHQANTDTLVNVAQAISVANYPLSDINAIIATGDLTNGYGTGVPKANVITWLNQVRDALITSTKPVLAQLGNHDSNDVGGDTALALSKQEQYQAIFTQLKTSYPAVNFGNSAGYKHYSYYDVTAGDSGNVRIIMLDMLDHSFQLDGNGKMVYQCMSDPVYSQEQIDWLIQTLASVPSGSGVILCNHYPFEPTGAPDASLLIDGTFVQTYQMIPSIINAFKNKTTLVQTFNDSKGLQNINVNADFSGVSVTSEFICHLCGHTHWKGTKNVQGFDNQLMIMDDALGSSGTVFSEVVRKSGTPISNCFSVLSIDRTEKKIYRSNFGAYKKNNEVEKSRIEIIEYV